MSEAAPPERVTVAIFGDDYHLAGDTPERLREIARLVDSTMRTIGAALPQPVTPARLAILAALNIASDLAAQREELRRTLSRWEERTGEVLRLIDAALPAEE